MSRKIKFKNVVNKENHHLFLKDYHMSQRVGCNFKKNKAFISMNYFILWEVNDINY